MREARSGVFSKSVRRFQANKRASGDPRLQPHRVSAWGFKVGRSTGARACVVPEEWRKLPAGFGPASMTSSI
jgi:hypothetical protein